MQEIQFVRQAGEAQTAVAGLDGAVRAFCRTVSGPFADSQKQLAAALHATEVSLKNQIRGFDQLHLIAEKTVKQPAEKQPSKSSGSKSSSKSIAGTKQLTRALKEAAEAVRELTDQLLPTLWLTIMGALPMMSLLAAGIAGVFNPVEQMLFGLMQKAAAFWMGLQMLWQEQGVPFLQGIWQFLQEMLGPLGTAIHDAVAPVLESIRAKAGEVWVKLSEYWQALKQALGNIKTLLADTWKTGILPLLTAIVEQLAPVIRWIGDLIENVMTSAGEILGGLLNAATRMLNGFAKFLRGVFSNDWRLAWEGIRDIFSGVWGGIVDVLRGAVNLGIDLLNALLRAVAGAVNGIVNSINRLGFTVPDWVPGMGGKRFSPNLPQMPSYQIPRLAQGAVLPANRPFLAVVGDQRNGTNIEAPLATIQEAVARVMGAESEKQTALLAALLGAVERKELTVAIGDESIGQSYDRYNRSRGVRVNTGVFANAY